jgi:heat shock protein HslJ
MDGYVTGNSVSRRRFATGFFLAILLILLASTTSIIDTVAWANGELRETLRNMTFPSEWTRSGQAPLVGGVYEELTTKDSTSKIVIRLTDAVASGTIGGQTATALVIVTEPGGSGVFFDLYLVQQRENHWRIMDRAHLGDRIRINTIKVEGGVIRLDLTAHGVHDGTCCPSERSSIYFALRGERLEKVSAPAQHILNPIEGHVWRWQFAVHVDGTRTMPTEPEHYTLHLGLDGQLTVLADCNQAGGRYRVEGSHLTLAVTHSTMAACQADSLDRQFLADLATISAWRLEDSRLYMDLTGGGTMVFTASSQ